MSRKSKKELINLELSANEVESKEFVDEKTLFENTFSPNIDFSDPSNFARYGLAEKYYTDSMEYIRGSYPFDGSLAEQVRWENESSFLDRYVFENLYPRNNGHVIFSADGWGTAAATTLAGSGLPNDVEYIEFFGGPNVNTDTKLDGDTEYSFDKSNVLSSDDVRESNLEFGDSNTVEFYLLKTGAASNTNAEVVCDIWNGETYGTSDYGRLSIVIDNATPDFKVEYKSGNTGYVVANTSGGNLAFDSAWHHWAFVFDNDTPSLKVYLDGSLVNTVTAGIVATSGTVQKNIVGFLGAFQSSSGIDTDVDLGYCKLEGKLDEFRFWKGKRTSRQVSRFYNSRVGGGTNTDDSNTTLGVYYKFNEGIVGDSTVDKNVIDYSGRNSNGSWTGYTSNSRSTNSAMVDGSFIDSEFQDPVLYAFSQDYYDVYSEYETIGRIHDNKNTTNIYHNLIHKWYAEEDIKYGEEELKILSQVIGHYFDTLYLQIEALPSIKNPEYKDISDFGNIPYGNKLLSSVGFVSPDLFSDASLFERFFSRDDDEVYDNSVHDVKQAIYNNIYNNLVGIFKSKGTERSFSELIRTFGIDDKVLNLNVYTDNNVFELDKERTKQVEVRKKYVSFENVDNNEATIYGHKSDDTVVGFPYPFSDYDDHLIAAYTMEDNAATSVIVDASGNVDAALTYSGLSSTFHNTSGKNNDCLNFPNTSNSRPDISALDTAYSSLFDVGSPFTLSGWFYQNTLPSYSAIMGSTSSSGSQGFGFQQRSGKIELYFVVDSSNYCVLKETGTSLSATTFQHIFWAYTGGDPALPSSHLLVVDGVLKTLTSVSVVGTVSTFATSVGVNLLAHPTSTSWNWDGKVDEVYFWNVAKDLTFAQNLYYSGSGIFYEDVSAYPNEKDYLPDTGTSANGLAMTIEADVIFPVIDRELSFTKSSLFGCHEVNVAVPTTFATNDYAMFQVYSERHPTKENFVRFVLESTGLSITAIETDYFEDVYSNQRWFFAVKAYTENLGAGSEYIRFIGHKVEYGQVVDSFDEQSLVGGVKRWELINNRKRFYVGAHRTNWSGAVLNKSDVKIGSLRVYYGELEDDVIERHAVSPHNMGTDSPYMPFQSDLTALDGYNIPQIATLILQWTFDTNDSLTGTTIDYIYDTSGGSTDRDGRYVSWFDSVAAFRYPAKGIGFTSGSVNDVLSNEYVQAEIQMLPENMYGDESIESKYEYELEKFDVNKAPVRYVYSFEKSMYRAISEEMVNFFGVVSNFSNLIGQTVDRYRLEYKRLNKLRKLFFEKIDNIPDLEKYVSYYRWIDRAVGLMLEDLIPASVDFIDGVNDVVESHILERSKHFNKFPHLNTIDSENIEGQLMGAGERNYSVETGLAPSDLRFSDTHGLWWKDRSDRSLWALSNMNPFALDSLVAYFSLEDNSSTSGVVENLVGEDGLMTLSQTTSTFYDTSGKHNGCFYMATANNSRVAVNNIDSGGQLFDVGSPFSISMWISLDSTPTQSCFFGSSMSTQQGFNIGQRSGRFAMYFYDQTTGVSSSIYAIGNTAIGTGAYIHYFVTYNGGAVEDLDSWRIYIDGKRVLTYLAISTGTVTTFSRVGPLVTGDIVIGGHGDGVVYNADGYFDEVAIWNEHIDEKYVVSLYNRGSGVFYDDDSFDLDIDSIISDLQDVFAYYSLDDNAATSTVLDSTGNYNGALTSSTTSTIHSEDTKSDGSFYFSSTSSPHPVVSAMDNPAGTTFEYNKPFTFSCWIKFDSLSVLRVFFGTTSSSAVPGFYFGQRYGDFNFYCVQDGSNYVSVQTWDDVFELNKWHHMLYSYDGVDLFDPDCHSLVLDGVRYELRITGSAGSMASITSTARTTDITIGAVSASVGYSFLGYMDEVAIWNKKLDDYAAVILYNYSRGRFYDDLGEDWRDWSTVQNSIRDIINLNNKDQETVLYDYNSSSEYYKPSYFSRSMAGMLRMFGEIDTAKHSGVNRDVVYNPNVIGSLVASGENQTIKLSDYDYNRNNDYIEIEIESEEPVRTMANNDGGRVDSTKVEQVLPVTVKRNRGSDDIILRDAKVNSYLIGGEEPIQSDYVRSIEGGREYRKQEPTIPESERFEAYMVTASGDDYIVGVSSADKKRITSEITSGPSRYITTKNSRAEKPYRE